MFYKIIKKYFIFYSLLLLLFGCVHSYYDKNPKLVETNIVNSWKELKVKVLKINEEEVTFHLWTEDFEKVKDSLEHEVFYNFLFSREKKYEDVRKELIVTGLMVPLLGVGTVMVGNEMSGCFDEISAGFGIENDNSAHLMYVMAGFYFIGGAVSLYQGFSLKKEDPKWKIVTRTQKKEESYKSLKSDSVTISLSNINFRKDYITDEKGNISTPVEDILPYFSGELSRITFDIVYKDLSTQITVDFDEIVEEKEKE